MGIESYKLLPTAHHHEPTAVVHQTDGANQTTAPHVDDDHQLWVWSLLQVHHQELGAIDAVESALEGSRGSQWELGIEATY